MSNEEVTEGVALQEGAGNDTGSVAAAGATAGGAGGAGTAVAGTDLGAAPGTGAGVGALSDAAGLGPDGYDPVASREDMLGAEATRPIEILQGVEMSVTVELGRTRMMVRDLLGLRVGSIIELDRQVGSNVDILVNGTLLAKGEVVVVDDEMGVRITDIAHRETVYEER
ncbi:MAG: flagellar motor switch protein FliN [Acidimicrobiales bacterium]